MSSARSLVDQSTLKTFLSPRPNEFRCWQSGHCIDTSLICNQVRDCPAGEDESTFCQPQLCPKSAFRCGHGRCVDKTAVCDNFNDCINGDDESDVLCKSRQCSGPDCDFPRCPAINSSRLLVSCVLGRQAVACDKEIIPGTVAKYSCGAFYEPASDFHKNNDEAVCQLNGQWSREILKCEPSCGYLRDSVPLIVNGFHTDIIFPWHAALFMRKDDGFAYACGGTLISESVVLSAAHCFAHVNETDVKIVVGKRRSDFKLSPDETTAQFFDVARIARHPLYLDRLGNYGSDLALVELNQSVALSDDIHPACVDWDLDDVTSHLSRNQLGLIVGMGITENETNSDAIRMARLPIVSNEDCVKAQPKDFQKFVTFTTFCAGWGNGTAVCNGDSGGGLMFLSADLQRWTVQGVVSLSPRRQSTFFCDPFKFTVFTKVGLYVNWIRFELDTIHDAHTAGSEYEPIL